MMRSNGPLGMAYKLLTFGGPERAIARLLLITMVLIFLDHVGFVILPDGLDEMPMPLVIALYLSIAVSYLFALYKLFKLTSKDLIYGPLLFACATLFLLPPNQSYESCDTPLFVFGASIRVLGLYLHYLIMAGIYRLASPRIGHTIAAAIGSAYAAFCMVVYFINIIAFTWVDGYVGPDLFRLAFEVPDYTAFLLSSMGSHNLVLAIAGMMMAAALWIACQFALPNARLPDMRLYLIFALVLIPPVHAGLLMNDPVYYLYANAATPSKGQEYTQAHLPPSIPEKRSVIWISIDSVRANHLKMNGHFRDTMPHIEAIAKKGTSVQRFYAPAPKTLESTEAALTGLYQCRQRSGALTAFDIFAHNGYETALFASSDMSWMSLDQRIFNRNVDMVFHRGLVSDEKEIKLWSGSYILDDIVTIDAAIEWMGNAKGPSFTYFDLKSPHMPYNVGPDNPPFVPYLTDSDTPSLLDNLMADRDLVIARYDNSLRYADQMIGKIVEAAPDDTIILVYSDHGESFLEHGTVFHATTVYDEQSRVPLVIRGYNGNIPLGQHPDILPTTLGILGADTSGFDGIDLTRNDRQSALFCLSKASGVFMDGHKYIIEPATGREMMYDLESDPLEETDVLKADPEMASKLKDEYLRLIALYG